MAAKKNQALKELNIKKPKRFDLPKARTTVKRIIQENKEWVREMAAK